MVKRNTYQRTKWKWHGISSNLYGNVNTHMDGTKNFTKKQNYKEFKVGNHEAYNWNGVAEYQRNSKHKCICIWNWCFIKIFVCVNQIQFFSQWTILNNCDRIFSSCSFVLHLLLQHFCNCYWQFQHTEFTHCGFKSQEKAYDEKISRSAKLFLSGVLNVRQ